MKCPPRLKILLYIDICIILSLLTYKSYLFLFETDFHSINLKGIESVKKAAKGGKGLSFVVIGNIKNSIAVFDKKLVPLINHDKPDMLISLGNAVLDGAEDKYRILYRSLKKLKSPAILCIGDNEIADKGALRFYDHFGPFYFSFGVKNSYFIFLDTTGETSESWQRTWLLKELEASQQYKYRFVFMNRPPYQVDGASIMNLKPEFIKSSSYRRFLMQTFSKFHVSAVFSSTVEIFDKKNIEGVPYYITGGGGGMLSISDENSFYHYLKVYVNHDGVSFQLMKQPDIPRYRFIAFAESLWVYIHSLFYVSIVNFILVLTFLALIGALIYIKATKEVDYYRDFGAKKKKIPDDLKLTIAMFTNTYYPFVGGVSVSIKRLADSLRQLGHKVYIFAPRYREESPEDDQCTIRCRRLAYYKNYAITNIFSPAIEKKFMSLHIDIVHVHHPFWMGTRGLKLAKKYNIPVILTYHTRLEKYAHNIPLVGRLFENAAPHYLIRRFALKCDAIAAPTFTAKEYLRNIGVGKIIAIIPSGIEFKTYKDVTPDDLNALSQKYKSNDEIVLLSVSRLTKEKNLYFLLEGIKYIKEHSDIPFRCIIAGDGPEKSNLLQFIENNALAQHVTLASSLTQDKLSQYYLFSDIFIFASQSETQGMVLLEAMAGRCPVIAVRSSGIEDVIHNGINGFKTVPDISIWSKKIISLMHNPQLLHKMSENAFSFSQKFSEESIAAKVAKLYIKVLRRLKHNDCQK
ncbi:MAG TPA: glycosyltransferase [Nitrospirae bacterium]|nr:alpha-monoglucosyldiacylglycerol synthase [bacterium BMS3Abin06]GBE04392.1 alpha-monoglucosyldiacylglycerol synthase [bacterium BMS3Abin10]HDH12629.1 glycosyltransferase [Nitrospirota bacterium]HDZ02661.1 glycosyltransferase [Nitrospirota bacterium]